MRTPSGSARFSPHRRGFTLVEMMVGLTVGLLITIALLVVFANASFSQQNLQRSSIQIDNGRYTTELLREEIQLAGFFGEIVTAAAAVGDPDPCATVPVAFVPSPLSVPAPVHGYTDADVLGCLANRRPGTSAIALRRLDIDPVAPAAIGPGNQTQYVQYSFCGSDTLAPSLVYDRSTAAFTLRARDCTSLNRVRAYVSRVYFVASCNVCTGQGDGVPTLKRLELVGNTLVETALVEGIEDLRFEYGFDINGDGAPDTYLSRAGVAGPTADWGNVMVVKVNFISRSLERANGGASTVAQTFDFGPAGIVTPALDGFVRQGYSFAVRLMNPSSAREMP